jgi:hypothetical protein
MNSRHLSSPCFQSQKWKIAELRLKCLELKSSDSYNINDKGNDEFSIYFEPKKATREKPNQ